MQKNLRYLGWFILLITALAGSFLAGVIAGFEERPALKQITALLNPETAKPSQVDFAPFWAAWKIVDEKFVANGHEATTTDEAVKTQKRVWGAIGGMVDALGDPYTVFLPPVEKKSFEESINGNFGGIGVEIDLRDKVLTVVSPLAETPAARAGIIAGDQIIKINGQPTEKMMIDEAVNLIRGEIGTTVKLSIARAGGEKLREFIITRAKIVIPTIKTEIKDGVFIIKLFSFSANASETFRAALREFTKAKTDKLIIDLRGNPGGLLEAAVDLASWFLPAGAPVVVERGRGNETEKIHRSYGYDVFTDRLKLAVLVDGGSASAAEILAGALSEYDKAILVGEKTFGKGSVQELVKVTDDSSIKITIAKWYTPKGQSLSDDGLMPAVIIEQPKNGDRERSQPDFDPQLNKTIEILNQKKSDR